MRPFIAALLMVLAPFCAVAGELNVPLSVEESAGVARVSEPACGGIPLPWGRFKKDQPFAVFDGDREVPAQVIPLVVDEKGFLRWVLVDVQCDLAAKEKKTLTLRAIAPVAAPKTPMKVAADDASVVVDTGAMKFAIAKDKPFGLFSSLEVGGKPVLSGGEVSYTDDLQNQRFVADKPASIEVEYAGPMRVTVCIKGPFVGDDKSRLGYIARITAWAGRTDVHLKYSLANSNPEHYTYRRIRDSSIELRFAEKATGTLLGADKPLDGPVPASLYQGLVPSVKGHAKAESGDKELWAGNTAKERPQGWLAAKLGDATVYACDWYFSDDPPRKLAATEASLVLSGIVPRFEGPPHETRPTIRVGHPMGDKCRWLFDCSHLTSQYRLDFRAPADGAALASLASSARSRLLVMAPPAWYSETEGLAIGKFGTLEDELACYKTWGWTYDPKQVPMAPHADRGRRYVSGEDNHYETEQDIVEALLLLYLRSGSREYFNTCEAWANYNLDLQPFRTNGWRWKDGGVWWLKGGPLGNRAQRDKDPVTGWRTGVPAPWGKDWKEPINQGSAQDLYFLGNSKACYCHNWGAGIAGWFCITGDRDALETAIDNVEQNFNTQAVAFGKEPGKTTDFSRDFTRSAYLTNATRLIAPTDEFVARASDFLAECYLRRPKKEPRGLFAPAVEKLDMMSFKYEDYVGKEGMAELEKLGLIIDHYDGHITDYRTKARWLPVINPHSWMFPPLGGAMECYWRLTGNEDAFDWFVAYGQAVGHLFYQERHYAIHDKFMLDFPKKGICKDYASWVLPEDNKNAEGIEMSGYLAGFHPDLPARAYGNTGDALMKQRAFDLWNGASHRGYRAKKVHNVGGVGRWVGYYGPHSESVLFTSRTFYEWARPRKDGQPPKPVTDLSVKVEGDKATISFTAPEDEGGGKVVRYQVKCSDKPIVGYQDFLKLWADDKDRTVTNWWMAANLAGEPAPQAPGAKESFTVTGLPEDPAPKFFAVCTFDDSQNRSAVSNVAEAGK